jgi:hypothetical protein
MIHGKQQGLKEEQTGNGATWWSVSSVLDLSSRKPGLPQTIDEGCRRKERRRKFIDLRLLIFIVAKYKAKYRNCYT